MAIRSVDFYFLNCLSTVENKQGHNGLTTKQ